MHPGSSTTANGSQPVAGRAVVALLWTRFSWRHVRLAPVASGLLVTILAVGVGVFFSIRLANRAASASFQNFTDLLSAESDGVISAPAGALPETVLRELREALGTEPVQLVPVLESTGTPPRRAEVEAIGSRPTIQLLGLDLVALRNLAGRGRLGGRELERRPGGAAPTAGVSAAEEFWAALDEVETVFITPALAREAGLKVGSRWPLIVNEREVALRVVGVLPEDPSRPAPPANVMLMDLPSLQRLTGREGRLDRVEFVLEDGPRRAERWARVRAVLERLGAAGEAGPRWTVGTSADRRAGADTMTAAFRLNLTILSLLALAVGLYLVFQALDGAVVRRREEIAILRSLGVTPGQIQAAWLVEATMLGVAGGGLGLLLGWAGAQGAVRLVGRTVNALYYATSAEAASMAWGEALAAMSIAVAASIVAGWLPARTAANTPPAQVAVRGGASTYAGGRWLRQPWLGAGLLVAGLVLTQLPALRLAGGGRISVAAYLAAIAWVLGAGIFGGAVLRGLGRMLGAADVSVPLRLALSQLREPSGRHRLAAAGLVCAVAMTAGMAILVGSFDTTMRGWIARTFQADLYLSSDGAQSASTQNRISAATWKSIAAHPGVARANAVQVAEVRLNGVTTMLFGGDLDFFRSVARPAWLEAPLSEDVFVASRNSDLALASESFCERFRVRRGDVVQLPTPSGVRRMTIAATYSDYGNERGSLLVDRGHFAAWFGDELASSLILQLKPGYRPEDVRAEVRAAHPGLGVYTNEYLRGEALRIFRQTFSITYALELIGVVVAVAGLGFTLASLLWERRGDLNTLRALGLRHSELAAAAAWEGLLTAFGGVAVGLVTSLALGWLLIFRVNKQTFGWTLQTDWPWSQLAALGIVVMAFAAATGWAAGRWGARLPAEREE